MVTTILVSGRVRQNITGILGGNARFCHLIVKGLDFTAETIEFFFQGRIFGNGRWNDGFKVMFLT